MDTPADITQILSTALTDPKELARVTSYIELLQSKLVEAGVTELGTTVEEKNDDDDKATATPSSSTFSVPQYDESAMTDGDDYEKAGDLKQQAADAKSSGDYEKALDLYNQAVVCARPSALLLANRAIVLEKLGHLQAAIVDCDLALQSNPDSAKALKTRGKLRASSEIGDWKGALSDLSQAQSIDFDPDLAVLLKELTEKRVEAEKVEASERIQKEEALRKKAEEIKQAKAAAEAEAKAAAAAGAGMPGGGMGGMPGGMPGGGGMGGMAGMMGGLMNDPELMAAMQNPKVMAAFQDMISAGGMPDMSKMTQYMSDPEVGPVLQKLMGKFGGGGGGAGGMPGGGMPGGMGFDADNGEDDDEMPDLEDLPDLD